ncbi:MAG: hypothetical protein EAZ57_11770 [Cytophagales bacterium]|nr:MAG: hypothetical protein EAZ67_12820 [Cytophagales bacterium]TAF59269.1 MAG: hypothetical protein EAZ57_11770 [Cytophagales bacterium]
MMQRLLLIWFCVFLSLFCTLFINRALAQPSPLHKVRDSLRTVLRGAADDTTKVNTLNKLASVLIHEDSKEGINTANRAFSLARMLSFKKGEMGALFQKGMAYYSLGGDAQALKYMSDALILAQKLSLIAPQAMMHEYMVFIYKRQNQPNLALESSWHTMRIGKLLKDSAIINKSYFGLGNVKFIMSQYDSALYYLHKSEAYYERTANAGMLLFVYNDLAATYNALEKMDKTLQYYEKSLKYLPDRSSEASGIILLNMAAAYLQSNKPEKSGEILDELEAFAPQHKSYHLKTFFYDIKSNYEEAIGNFQSALMYAKLARAQSDSNFVESKKADIARVQQSFEVKQAEEDNRQLKVKQEEELSQKNRVIYIVAGVLVLVFLSGLWLFRTYRLLGKTHEALTIKNQEINQQKEEIAVIAENLKSANTSVEEQKSIIERKNKDIMSSINYASRIQNALLPPSRLFKESFNDFLLFFKPRDVVSGDFYWFKSTTHPYTHEPVLYAAVADCTGHGVPGAFMTVIGNELIEQVFTNTNWIEPLEVLQKLNEKMGKALHTEDSNMRDGMDMAFCRIMPQSKRIDFAGAHRPLVYIRDGQVHTIKAAKASIGGHAHVRLSQFEQHTLTMQEGDTYFMYSDGITDQFGGPNNRKFGSKRLQGILIDNIHDLNEARIDLDEKLSAWMKEGKEHQIDDILVLGFKF